MNPPYFDHEKLHVYQESLTFIGWWEEIISGISGLASIKDQMDRASTSVPLNIAEGNGKYSAKDRSRFFQISMGSALECAACLDVLVARKRLTVDEIDPGKRHLQRVVGMLVRLIGNLADRVSEASEIYEVSEEQNEPN